MHGDSISPLSYVALHLTGVALSVAFGRYLWSRRLSKTMQRMRRPPSFNVRAHAADHRHKRELRACARKEAVGHCRGLDELIATYREDSTPAVRDTGLTGPLSNVTRQYVEEPRRPAEAGILGTGSSTPTWSASLALLPPPNTWTC